MHIYMEVKRYLQASEKFRGRKITFKSLDQRTQSLKDFYRYIKVTPDQAVYQVEKIWKEREQVLAGV